MFPSLKLMKEKSLMDKAFRLCLLGLTLLLLGFATTATTTAAGCCPILCTTDSSCDATCGVGLGRCVGGATCCRVCLCSTGGS
jgi:hypothetical protein